MTAAIPIIARIAAGGAVRAGVSAGAAHQISQRVGSPNNGDADGDEPGSEYGKGIPLGNGNYLDISEDTIRALLHSDMVEAELTRRAQAICDRANSLARTKGAEYEVIVQNRAGTTRARAFVKPANFQAMLDDAINSTLLKAAAGTPSEPRPGTSSGHVSYLTL